MHTINVLGINVEIAQSIINMWYIMGALTIFALVVYFFVRTGRFKTVPESKFQIFIEGLVEFVYNTTRDNMGERNMRLAPYVGSLGMLLLFSNLAGLYAFKKIPTSDYSVCLGLALATFLVVQGSQLKAHRLGGYFKELFEPVPFLFPLKILEKFTPLLSMSLRLFCNITAGYIVMELVYSALGSFKISALASMPPAMALIPVPLHFYFDVFDAVIQTIVFVMLTMVLTANATEVAHANHEAHTVETGQH